jgi:hypothetical protein
MISRFDECWIPDYKDPPALSGDLSHKYPLPANVRFIGPLSRFHEPGSTISEHKGSNQITAVISGPEPQRSIFENLIMHQLKSINLPAYVVGGKPECDPSPVTENNLTILPHLNSNDLHSLLSASSLVICRSGYSSIMDLEALGAKALFVPTPGQTEQIYLASLHRQSGTALWCKQEELNLHNDIPKALTFRGFTRQQTGDGLAKAITDLKNK